MEENSTYRWSPDPDQPKPPKKKAPNFKRASRLALVISLALILVFAAMTCFYTVDDKQQAVVTTFGKVTDVTEAGVHFKLPWQEVVKMDNRVQKETLDMTCFSSDIQEVTMKYTVNYQISKQDAMTIYKTIGIDYYNTVIAPCITESVKIVTARYNAEELISSRSNMAVEIEGELQEKLLQYNIELVGTSIEDMDFTDAFTDAVEAKQVAEQNKLRAETEAEQRVIEANAAAEIKKVEADAAAYQTLTRAEAEAKANREIAESLTQSLIDYTYAQAWDGKLPTFMTGENGVLPFMNVDRIVADSNEPAPTEPVNPVE